MRIGVATTSYPRFEGDPAGSFVRALGRALVARGHTCEVLAPDDDAATALGDEGIEIERVTSRLRAAPPAFYGAGVPDNLRRDPRALASALAFVPRLTLAARARAKRWDAAMSHWAIPSSVALGASFGATRHVAVWHSADVWLARRLVGRGAWPLLRGAAAEHVFVAAHLRARLGADADRRAHVIPMGIELPRSLTRVARDPSRALRALVLGRLVPIKRVELAIEACDRAGVSLVVAGDGPERARLEALARRATVPVRFVGVVDEAARERLLAESDVLLATSAHSPHGATEGYPVAPREALAHGVVVLATDDPVHTELARRVGAPVCLAPEPELARALAQLAGDPRRLSRLSAEACGAVRADAWPNVARAFEALLVA
ncbi:MAG: glycosyltransferase family 4 protein [Sandaracinaceae bacterium]|nr:glycosyltransferase family 4 protein [Sandaracinaceae bacterium]